MSPRTTLPQPTSSELLAFGAAVALAGMALLLLSPASSAAQDEESDKAFEYLAKMAGAEGATYQARQLVVYFGRPQSAAVVDVRSSADGQFVRAESGSVVTKLWRRADIGIVSDGQESISDAAPPPVPLQPSAVLAKYEINIEKPQRIFGLELVPLALVRRSDRTTVERLWIHSESGVVYRRELYGAEGKLVGMSAILDMRWGKLAAIEPFEAGAHAPSRVSSAAAPNAPTMLPNGYHLLRAYRIQGRGKPADHWLYTDGLHALSVFRTEGGLRPPEGFQRSDLAGTPGWVGPGPGTWAWEGDGASWVLVAEEPALDPVRLTASFPQGGPSVWARLGSVWARAFRAIGALFD